MFLGFYIYSLIKVIFVPINDLNILFETLTEITIFFSVKTVCQC